MFLYTMSFNTNPQMSCLLLIMDGLGWDTSLDSVKLTYYITSGFLEVERRR